MIESLELVNFRNFSRKIFEFEGPDILLSGPNGSGKTNILESIAYLSILRSFRGAHSRELTKLGERGFELKCRVLHKNSSVLMRLAENLNGTRELELGQSKLHRSSDFIREFRTVAFVPEDREIISGSSGFRRRFFDMLISSVDVHYLQSLGDYNRALMQRNRALKNQNPALCRSFEPELAGKIPVISAARREYASKICALMQEMLGERGKIEIRYTGDHSLDPEQNRKILNDSREHDLQRGFTSFGVQLDEFEFRFNEKPVRYFGSTGQKGILSLLLKLSEFRILKEKSSAPVIVLADDVTGELDHWNIRLFLEMIAGADQRFFTFAELPGSEYFAKFRNISLQENL